MKNTIYVSPKAMELALDIAGLICTSDFDGQSTEVWEEVVI